MGAIGMKVKANMIVGMGTVRMEVTAALR